MAISLNSRNLILFFLAVLIFVPPFFSGGRHFLIINGWLVLLGIIVLLVLFAKKKTVSSSYYFLLIVFWWLAFLLFSVFSVIQSIVPWQSFLYLFQLIGYAVLMILVIKLDFSEKEIKFFLFLLVAAAFVLSLVGIYEFLLGRYQRLTSTFYWPNPFAGYLLLIIPLAIVLLIKAEKQRSRMILILVNIVLLVGFILTQSRGAWLTLLVVFFIILFFLRRQQRFILLRLWPIFLLAVSLAISLFYFKFAQTLETPRYPLTADIEVSQKTRLNYWHGALRIFLSRPLSGSGLDTFSFIYPLYQKDALSAVRYAHNYFLQMMAEVGLLATLIFVCLIISFFWLGLKKIDQPYVLAISAGLFGSILHNFIDFDWYYYANTIIFWFLVGLLVAIGNSRRPIGQKKKTEKYILFLLAIFLILVGLINLRSEYFFQKAERATDLIKAEKLSRASLFLNPQPKYYGQLADILFARSFQDQGPALQGQLINQAREQITKAIILNSYNPYFYHLRARMNFALAKFNLAEQDLKQALKIDPINRPAIYIDLISYYLDQGNLELAEKLASQILVYFPDEVVARQEWRIMANQEPATKIREEISLLYYFQGLIKLRQRNFSLAKASFQKALAIDPKNNLAKIELEKLSQ